MPTKPKALLSSPMWRGSPNVSRMSSSMASPQLSDRTAPSAVCMVVHPKDKRDPQQSADVVYEIPCDNCKKTYVGETARLFKTRLGEYKKEANKFCETNYTRAKAQELKIYVFKSAAAEYAVRQNHVLVWGQAKQIEPQDGWKNWYGFAAEERTLWTKTRGPTSWKGFLSSSSRNGNPVPTGMMSSANYKTACWSDVTASMSEQDLW